MSLAVVSSLVLVGCENEEVEPEETVVEEVTPLVIAKPEIVDVEDDRYDLEKIQDNLDKINEGERLEGYKKQNDYEQIVEIPEGFETKDEVYNKIGAEELAEGTHLVYIGRDSCPYCKLLRTHLDQVVDQLGLGMDYVDTEIPEDSKIMVEDFGLQSVPQIQVFHEGEVVAEFPQSGMYLTGGADYESLSNGLGDLLNVYLGYKHDLDLDE